MKKKSYSRYRKTKQWQGKRRTIMKRAGNKCRKCKKRHATQVHHETYKRIGRERLSDLTAVCDQRIGRERLSDLTEGAISEFMENSSDL